MKSNTLKKMVLLSSLFGSQAFAAPIFVNRAEKYGLGKYSTQLRVLEDSEDKNVIYFLPANLTLASKLFSSLPSFLRPLMASNFETLDLDDQTSQINFYVTPDLDLNSFLDIAKITAKNAEEKGFLVGRLECFDPTLKLVNVPPFLMTKFSQTDGKDLLIEGSDPFFQTLSQFIDPEIMVTGYLTRFSIETKDAAALENLLAKNGAKGQAEYTCNGYTEQMTPGVDAPTQIKTSIPLSITFPSGGKVPSLNQFLSGFKL